MTDKVPVAQEDREAAASGYLVWISSNRVIPTKMREGRVDDHSMVQAFARHRIATREQALREAATLVGKLSRNASCGCRPCYGHQERAATYEECEDAILALIQTSEEQK